MVKNSNENDRIKSKKSIKSNNSIKSIKSIKSNNSVKTKKIKNQPNILNNIKIKKLNSNIIMPLYSTGYMMDSKVIQSVIPDSSISINNVTYKKAFMNIFIQDVNRKFLNNALFNLVIINHELFFHKGVNKNSEIYDIDFVLCKTDIAVRVAKDFKNKYKFKYIIYKIGFTSLFPILKIKKNYDEMLHSAGSHHWKQTDTIIKLWLKQPQLPKITITCEKQCYKNIEPIIKNRKLPNNIKIYTKLISKDKYIKLKNEIGIHIVPSLTEGYGHYINEARMLGSLILTSNYAPMNELVDKNCGILVDCNSLLTKRNNTKICYINEENLLKGINKILKMKTSKKKELGKKAYKKYRKDKLFFEKRTKKLFDFLYNKIKNKN